MSFNLLKVNNTSIVGVDDFPLKDSQNLLRSNGLSFLINTLENGLYIIDSNYNVIASFDNNGFHCVNILEYAEI